MRKTYTDVKKVSLFTNTDRLHDRMPHWSNGKVSFDVDLREGIYTFAVWKYDDTGTLLLKIQRIEDDGGGVPESPSPAPSKADADISAFDLDGDV